MDAAEQLLAEVNPDQLYPMEFIVYRLTGYRPESGIFDTSVVGKALIRDLGAFIQAISADLELPDCQSRGQAISLDEVAARLKVDRRTVQRRRGDGLVLHWVRDSDDRSYLGCFPDALDRFLEKQHHSLPRTRQWKRLSTEERMAIIERARQIRQSSESSLDSVAAIIGQETGRARSTVRDVLRRHDQSCDQQIFPEHRALAAREIELCCRARRVGIPLSKCADRLNRSVPAIHRAILKHRVGILKSIPLTWIDQPVFARQDADEVLLGGEPLQAGLVGPDQSIHLADIPQPDSSIDLSRWIAASHWLVARASRSLATLSKQPLAMHIDRIECDLLWAGRIRASLVMHGLPASLQACEHWLGRSVESLPREAALNLLQDALRSTWHVLDDIDPGRADRLSGRCASAMDRLLSSRTPLARSRASARHQPGDLDIAWPLRQMVPWPTLEPETYWISRVERLEPGQRSVAILRWGLEGVRPHDIAEIAEINGTTASSMQRRLHRLEMRMRTDSGLDDSRME